jgi:DNA processing protein
VPGNFPARNRLIAGLSDATIVIESDLKGGSLITADIANSYDRDVFAFPGKIGDKYSRGCHLLIKQNKAALIENAIDLISNMNWESEKKSNGQLELFGNFDDDEQMILNFLLQKDCVHFDEMTERSTFSINKLSSILLQLELKNTIYSMPGKIYKIKTV